MLTVENLDVFYGDAQALDGVSLEVAEGAHRRDRRRQRRRQDVAHPHHRRHAPAGARPHPFQRRGHRRLAEPSGLQSRHRPGRRGPPDLPDADRRRKPRDGRDAAARAGHARPAASSACSPCSRVWRNARRQAAGTLSGGEQQMLAIGRCLMGAPDLVMFDEPSLGLAPTDRAGRAAAPSATSTARG